MSLVGFVLLLTSMCRSSLIARNTSGIGLCDLALRIGYVSFSYPGTFVA